MALSIFKSASEAPWDRFSHRMDRALDAASVEFKSKHRRHLRLGSPVRLGGATSDIIRVPIEVHGGRHEYAIAYLEVKDLKDGSVDSRRLETIAMEAASAAQPYI
jgi:hypothetical protein